MINGQYTIFDIREEGKPRRPCEYSFERYIGQRVRLPDAYDRKTGQITCVHGKIVEIEKYYTTVRATDGQMYVGTPTTMARDE